MNIFRSIYVKLVLGAAFFLPVILSARAEAQGGSALASFTKFLSPGVLTASHAREEKLRDCYACHTLTRGVDNDLCLDCHKVLRERLATGSGFHGKLDARCYTCHTDHKGLEKDIIGLDPGEFNHRLANYPLTGKHAEIKCDKCHLKKDEAGAERIRYIGLKFGECTDCHQDPHPPDFSPDCKKCHTTDGWTGRDLMFSHMRDSNYKLQGKHQLATCDKCHRRPEPEAEPAGTRFMLPNTHCLQCHADEHGEQLSMQCENCHSESGWTGRELKYSHARDSKFKLSGKHQSVACYRCHKTDEPGAKLAAARFRFTDTACERCHEDVHDGQLSKRCEECHTELGWTGRDLRYSHTRDSKFKLSGKHQAVDCNKCHKSKEPEAKLAAGQFRFADTRCEQCHKDEHQAQFSRRCEECHGEFGWKGEFLKFDHDTQSTYKLDATHGSVVCAQCHQQKKYKPLKSDCADCHREYDEIMAGLSGEAAASVGPDPHWGRVRCDQCHDTQAGRPSTAAYQQKCIECHNKRYGPLLLDWMKDWFARRYEVRTLLRQAGESGGLSAPELERFSQRLREVEKVGAHNFQLAPHEWKNLEADLDRAVSRDSAKKGETSGAGGSSKPPLSLAEERSAR